MSARRSLTLAIRDQLRDTVLNGGLAIPSSSCEVMGDGRPPPIAGTTFYAVHQGGRTKIGLATLDSGAASRFGAYLTITSRTQGPFDRIGTAELDIANGLDDLADAAWNCLYAHQWSNGATIGVMTRANAFLPVGSYPWLEPLYPTDQTSPQPVTPDWFSASEAQQHKAGAAYQETTSSSIGRR